MITITRNNRELYIGIDYPTPRPEIPEIIPGQIFKLYEYTYTGPKYIGTYMAKINDETAEIGPLKILTYIQEYEIHYRGYHQYIEFKNSAKYYTATPLEGFIQSIKKLIITDDEKFFKNILKTTTNPYNFISYIDGVLKVGDQIHSIDDTVIKPAVENGAIYYVEIDENTFPPCETTRTKILTIPFEIKNGRIKKVRFHDGETKIEIHYPHSKITVTMDTFTGEIKRLKIKHGKKTDVIYPTIDEFDPTLIPLLITTIDEKGPEAYELIKTF